MLGLSSPMLVYSMVIQQCRAEVGFGATLIPLFVSVWCFLGYIFMQSIAAVKLKQFFEVMVKRQWATGTF